MMVLLLVVWLLVKLILLLLPNVDCVLPPIKKARTHSIFRSALGLSTETKNVDQSISYTATKAICDDDYSV